MSAALDMAIPGDDKTVYYKPLDRWELSVLSLEGEISRFKSRLERATTLQKRDRLTKRIQNAEARILALKLAYQ